MPSDYKIKRTEDRSGRRGEYIDARQERDDEEFRAAAGDFTKVSLRALERAVDRTDTADRSGPRGEYVDKKRARLLEAIAQVLRSQAKE